MNILQRLTRNYGQQQSLIRLFATQVEPAAATADGTNKAIKLRYNSFANEKKAPIEPPLILIHGLFGSKRNWNSLAKAFSYSGRRVIAVDARNHGHSPHVREMDYLLMSQDIAALMKKLQFKEAIILGHSMGGKIAMALALTQPELVTKLIVEDISPECAPSTSDGPFMKYINAMKTVEFNDTLSIGEMRKTADAHLRQAIPDKAIRNFILTGIIEDDEGFRWKHNLKAIEEHLIPLLSFIEFDSQYKNDTLFIAGKHSDRITKEKLPLIKKNFPKVNIKYIDAGHWVHSEKPHQFLDTVFEFIGEKSHVF